MILAHAHSFYTGEEKGAFIMSTSAEGGTPAADQNKAIAEQFLSAFYQMFDTNRPGLAALYVCMHALLIDLLRAFFLHIISL